MWLFVRTTLLLLLLFCRISIQNNNNNKEEEPEYTLGPFENSSDPNIDEGHKILLDLARTVKGFKQALGYNWTGKEILCNCSSSHCGHEQVMGFLRRSGLEDVCVGQACYHQKRISRIKGKLVKDEHWGCFGGDKQEHAHHDSHELVMCANTTNSNVQCCKESFCHKDIEGLTWPDVPEEDIEELGSILLIPLISVVVCAVILCVGLTVFCIRRIRRKADEFRLDDGVPLVEMNNLFGAPVFPNRRYEPFVPDGTNSTFVTLSSAHGGQLDNLLRDLDVSDSFGMSSADMGSLLQKNTFSSKLVRLEAIGQGRFGTVYKCLWKEQIVATKIIESRNEQSYYREVAMYKNGIIRHTNILQFLGDDMIDSAAGVERCLVFEYHQNGSLDKYLSAQTVPITTAVRMVFSMASGLSFLHNSMETANQTKPPIAHRDLKSGNILVKGNLMVCISDLGLAVCLVDGKIGVPSHSESDHFEIEHKERSELVEKCGTMRYLPPELLNDTMDLDIFEAFMKADIYSMGLVMYEICRRTHIEGEPETGYEEAMPYFRQIKEAGGIVGDVDHNIMKEIVVDQQERPDMTPWWQNNTVMKELERLMGECWMDDPSSRLTANNVIKAMQKLADQEGIDVSQT